MFNRAHAWGLSAGEAASMLAAMELNRQIILITGAARGLGAAIAEDCVRHGGRVIVHYGRSAEAARALQARLGEGVIGCLGEDLRRPGAGQRLWTAATEMAGEPPGALVNNAGIYPASPLQGPIERWRQGWADNLAVNLLAPAELGRCAVADFRQTGGGVIVNIASRAGIRGDDADHDAYAAAKGGLLAQTRTLARALAGQNILCYALAPGWIETGMAPPSGPARERALSEIPLGKMAQPGEAASLVTFLLSRACPSATGSTFDINGASHVR